MNDKVWMRFWRRAVWVTGLLRWLPYLRMVGLNGSMVNGKLHEYSDIDVFIVTRPGRIFTARAMVVFFTHILNVRRHGYNIAGRLCLNRFATMDNLTISEPNQYHADTFHNLIPLFSVNRCYQRYLEANGWMVEYHRPLVFQEPVFGDSTLTWTWRVVWEWLLWPVTIPLESYLRHRQIKAAVTDIRARHPKSKVVITDRELRFHLFKKL